MSHHINITRIKAVARALSSLNETVVFVGGDRFAEWLSDPDFLEGLTTHLDTHTAHQQVQRITSLLKSNF